MHIYLYLAEDGGSKQISIFDKDRVYIDALISEENTLNLKRRHVCNGRFLTMHKRRRKKLQTRSLVFEPAILDDILHGQVACILRQVGKWRFNAFTLETVTGGKLRKFPFNKNKITSFSIFFRYFDGRTITTCIMCSFVPFLRPVGPF